MNKKRTLLIAAMILVVGIVVIAYLFFSRSNGSQLEIAEQTRVTRQNSTRIDAVNTDLIDYRVGEGIVLDSAINKTPRFYLSSPGEKWFSDNQMQSIAMYLGFDSGAIFTDLGTTKIWTQGGKRLEIDKSIGRVKFNGLFDVLPKDQSAPNLDGLTDQIQDLLLGINLSGRFLDFEHSRISYFVLNDDRDRIVVNDLSEASLVRIDVPYVVSDIKLLLPIETYFVFDLSAELVGMDLFVPNIDQTSQTVKLIGYEEAVSRMSDQAGIVVAKGIEEKAFLDLNEVEFAFYLGQRDFLDLSSVRYLNPVYLFKDNDYQVAVVASDEAD